MKYSLVLLVLLYGCASVQPLKGGDKDTTPPKIISTSVDSASLNVSTKVFTFTFDEYVNLKSVSDKFLISPNQTLPPSFDLKNKKLKITLNDSLLSNTTYTFQFNGAIVDNNESNPLEYKYIFSTGDYIDSAQYSGFVTNYTTKKPCNTCNVHLYKDAPDSFFLVNKPTFIGRTNEQGYFKISNLPNKYFTALATTDDNNNLLWSKDEEISNYKDISISDSTKPDTFYTFLSENLDPINIKINSKTPGIYLFTSNKLLNSDSIKIYFNNSEQGFKLNPSLDTITSFYTKKTDSLTITLIHKLDTFIFQDNKVITSFKYIPKLTTGIHPEGILIKSKTPIETIDSSLIFLTGNDSIIIVDFKLKQINPLTYLIHTNTNNYNDISLRYLENFITDVYNNKTNLDSIKINICNNEPSTVNLVINGIDSTTYILLIKSSDKVVQRYKQTGSSTITLNTLKPGMYTIETITDINNNGVWDTGNIWNNSKPEPLHISEQIEIRNNWDKELIINVK